MQPPISAAAPRAPQSLADVLGILKRHAIPSILVAGGVLGLVAAGLILCPRTYQSEAKLNVRVGRESIGLDPTATTAQTISVSDSREFEMNSVMDLIDSRAVLERVVDTLGPQAILTGRLPADIPSISSLGTRAAQRAVTEESIDPVTRDKAIRELADSIKSTAGRRSSVITITARAPSPELAQAILRIFLDSFHSVHLNASRATGSYHFFEEQCRLLAQQLDAANRDLTAAKDRVGIVSLEGRQKTLEDQVAAIQAASVKNVSALASSEAMIASLKNSIDNLPERLVTLEVSGFPDDAMGATRKNVNELRLKEQDLLAKYTSRHPQVIAVRQQLTEAESMVNRGKNDGHQSTTSTNPTREQLQLRLLSEAATAAALRAEAESLKKQSTQLQAQLAALNSHDSEITRQVQRVDVLKTSLKGYTEKLEQSRIDHALADVRISNVSVIQPATWLPKPVSPKKSLVLAFGLVVAAISGFGAAFGREYLMPAPPGIPVATV